jgi:MFS family permease
MARDENGAAPLQPNPERMNAYCWWVLAVGMMSWLFDCMDQRIFVLSRQWALRDLLEPVLRGLSEAQAESLVDSRANLVTAAMIVGWAVGGLFFGIVGDKWGRVRTLSTSILVYSLFTGLSGLSQTWYDFCLWRFLMGCGIGGAFATAATLIAETMPSRYRALALGGFQALSASGNMIGSLVARDLIKPSAETFLGAEVSGWRVLFFFGILPAFLIVLIMRTIKEPDTWQAAQRTAKDELDRQLGDLTGMMRHRRWRRNVIVGVMLSVAGVVGLWGIGFWTPELISEALREATDAQKNYVASTGTFVQEIGSLCGMFFFTLLALWLGRRATFGICFILAYLVVAFVFTRLNSAEQAYWMLPLVGFTTLSVFGGYAIYFPELFPTRLRATGTGICYNVGRIIAAVIILFKIPIKGLFEDMGLKAQTDAAVVAQAADESFFGLLKISPFRAVAVAMCTIYVVGLIALIWAPETKGKPLPTDDD